MPLPLSLMPGPSGTESRWAPTTTIRSARPPGVSASTLNVFVVFSVASTATRIRSPAVLARASPRANVVLTAGMAATGGSSVPKNRPNRSSFGSTLPWLKTITALAPAAAALSTLTRKKHVPRWMSAMLPGVKPAKSAASQPLVEARSPWRLMSTAWTAAVTSPEPE